MDRQTNRERERRESKWTERKRRRTRNRMEDVENMQDERRKREMITEK